MKNAVISNTGAPSAEELELINSMTRRPFNQDELYVFSVTLCDNEYIRVLNSRYRGKDKPTDVLSFPLYEDGNFTVAECISGAMLGDIVISLERAREQAEELGHGFLREVAFLAIHSTLHLLGYDHERSEADEEAQCSAQREIIEKVEI